MPKRSRSSGRVTGYIYRKDRYGKKFRVYYPHESQLKNRSSRRKIVKAKRFYPRRQLDTMDITGYGAYRMSRGSQSGLSTNGPPQVRNSKGRGFIVRHREYITDIVSSIVFQNMVLGQNGPGLTINPGNPACFPWLSTIAAQFEEWIPRGIVFEYKTTSTDLAGSAANPALGVVIMATEYNVLNPVFGNKQQMENYEFAKSCKPSLTMLHQVETAKGDTPVHELYVRTGALPANSDARLYDLGIFQIAVQGMQSSAATIGELWVSYEIEFRKPKITIGQDEVRVDANMDHFNLTPNTAILPATPFGTDTGSLQKPTTGSTLGGRVSRGIVPTANQTPDFFIPVLSGTAGSQSPTGGIQSSTANTYYFPQGISSGNYMIQYLSVYGTPGGTQPTITPTYVNCKALNLVNQNAADELVNRAATTTTSVIWTEFVTITASNANIVVTFGGCTDTVPTFADLYVCQLPNAIN